MIQKNDVVLINKPFFWGKVYFPPNSKAVVIDRISNNQVWVEFSKELGSQYLVPICILRKTYA